METTGGRQKVATHIFPHMEIVKEIRILKLFGDIRFINDITSSNTAITFIDNKEREGYNPIDEARHYKHMQDKYGEKVYSTHKLAEKYQENQSYYVRKLQLLELPEKVMTQVITNKISEGHCHHINSLYLIIIIKFKIFSILETVQQLFHIA